MTEDLKKPQSIIAIAGAVGLVGTIVYFHRQFKQLKSDFEDLSDKLKTTIGKLPDLSNIESVTQQLKASLAKCNDRISGQDDILQELIMNVENVFIEQENVQLRLAAIEAALKELGSTYDPNDVEFVDYTTKFTLSDNYRPPQQKNSMRSGRGGRGGRGSSVSRGGRGRSSQGRSQSQTWEDDEYQQQQEGRRVDFRPSPNRRQGPGPNSTWKGRRNPSEDEVENEDDDISREVENARRNRTNQ